MSALESIAVKSIDGKPQSLGDYAGKVRLVVNVASKCGLTPQYTALEALYRKYQAQGFEVLGFPANEFAAQEPGSDEDIKTFCSTKYDVTFPMFSKIVVKGAGRHPLYSALIAAQPGEAGGAPAEISWNFEKFLIDRQGEVVARFSPKTEPDAAPVIAAIERALGG